MRILQCLNWDIKDIERQLEKVAEQGFDTIQIGPVQPLKEDNKDNWWIQYQPCGFTIGNQFGSKKDLIDLCERAKCYNISITVDVIFTHMAEGKKAMEPHDRVDKNLVNNKYLWREKKSLLGPLDYDDRYRVTHHCAGNLPGLNMYNWDLQDMIAEFLNNLLDCGVAGFRVDSGKSIPLPTDDFEDKNLPDSRGCDFFPRILEKISERKPIIYIEVLNVSSDLLRNYSRYGLVLTEMVYNDLEQEKVVAFAESHDQYFNWRHNVISPIADSEITNMYTNKVKFYDNTLYYARPFSNAWQSSEIKKCHAYRK